MTVRGASAPPLFRLDPERFPGANGGGSVVANLTGDYAYLSSGYYVSLDAELSDVEVMPTTTEALDAYVVAIAMQKARAAGIAVPDHDIVTDRFPPPPLLAYPLNPFSLHGELVLDPETLEARRKGLTYTGKYAVLVQRLPVDHRIDVVRVLLGRTLVAEYEDFASRVFAAFPVPLMKVRVVVTPKAYLFSAIEPLPFAELLEEERATLEGLGTWRA